ncbi:hypothetical protein [Virgibacillus salexigens]|uniref:hypothetical protein n=1 Tax=Virgibacillus salexigens TaxID=61016 RepID=UPI003081E0E5
MIAKTIKRFYDKKEKKHRVVNEQFEVSAVRFKDINSTKFGKLVEEVKNEFPKHVGGGNYELSNGEKVKGKEKALAAEEELK